MPRPIPPDLGPRVWPIGVALVVLCAGLVAIHAYLVGTQCDPGAEGPVRFGLPFLLMSAGASSAWIGFVAVAAARLGRESERSRLGLVETVGFGPLEGLVALAGALAASQAADLALRLSGAGRGTSLTSMLESLAGARGGQLVTALLVIGLATGVAEELFFRGYVQRRLVRRFGPVAGVVAAAALFGLFHFDPQHSAYAFVFGMFVGMVALWTGSTWPAIGLHAVNNAASILFVGLGVDRAAAVTPATRAPLAAAFAGCAAVALTSAWWIRRRTRAAAA